MALFRYFHINDIDIYADDKGPHDRIVISYRDKFFDVAPFDPQLMGRLVWRVREDSKHFKQAILKALFEAQK